MPVLFIILAVIFASVVGFLGFVLLEKYKFMLDFIKHPNQVGIGHYHGSRDPNHKPGMRNIVLRGSKPFCALVGFKLHTPVLGCSDFSYYDLVRSDDHGRVVISTYVGKSKCDFHFFVKTDPEECNLIRVSSDEYDQQLHPNAVFPFYWCRRLGFYG